MLFLGVGSSLVGAAARNIGLTAAQIGLMVAIQNVGFGISVAASGALSDTRPKPLLLLLGSLLLGVSFLAFYATPLFWFNLAVMTLIGAGTGVYEGVTDALLFDLHTARSAFYVNINHLFVTLGSLAIAVYLLFLQVQWRAAVVQSGIAVLFLALVFAIIRVPASRQTSIPLADRVRAIGRSPLVAALFLASALTVGVELGTVGILSTYLADVRGLSPTQAQLGLVFLLLGVATGRLIIGLLVRPERVWPMMLGLFAFATVAWGVFLLVDLGSMTLPMAFVAGLSMSALLPLILSCAGAAFPTMTGTVLGTVKVAMPIGGIVLPLLMGAVATAASLETALVLFPVALGIGFLLLLGAWRRLPVLQTQPS
jgi:MFS family permease